MTSRSAASRQSVADSKAASAYLPPRSLEYVFYLQVWYSIMGPVVGLSINLLGVAMLALLAALLAMRFGRYTAAFAHTVALPLACGCSFIAVQVLVHGESLMSNGYVRSFVPWMLTLVVIQWLALRPGLLHRAAIAVFIIGVSTLPYMTAFQNATDRAGLESGIGIGNPNDLGAWFGFCGVYFTILGIETRRQWIRGVAFVLSGACIFVVGLTVSRAPLLAAALCVVFAFRRVLKRGFIPLLSIVIVGWIAYGMGLFDRATTLYQQRGLEETGRFLVWPMAIERFLQAPFTGVGASHIDTFIPEKGIAVSPHNSFLFIALASGVVPLVFFALYWVSSFRKAFSAEGRSLGDSPFHTALLLYAFLISLNLNQTFMMPWMVATLAVIGAARVRRTPRRLKVSDARIARRSAEHRRVTALAGHAGP